MDSLRLESSQEVISDLLLTHADAIGQIHTKLDILDLSLPASAINTHEADRKVRITVIKSLWFPRMRERIDQIQPAHESTYKWILQLRSSVMVPSDDAPQPHVTPTPEEWLRVKEVIMQFYMRQRARHMSMPDLNHYMTTCYNSKAT